MKMRWPRATALQNMDSQVELKEGRIGRGIFAKQNYRAGEKIMIILGERVGLDGVREEVNGRESRALQIGPKSYILPTPENALFYFNHSCEPNTWIRIADDNVSAVALRTIDAGEELTFDYSTTMDENDWELQCHCGSSKCRGMIRDFKHLPLDVRERYAEMGMIPEYLKSYAPEKSRA